MRPLSVQARVEQAVLTDDGLETIREWEPLVTATGLLTPITLEQAARIGLTPDQASHQLVLGNGLPFTPGTWRVVIDHRVYELVRATNLPTRTVLTLRSAQNLEEGGETS